MNEDTTNIIRVAYHEPPSPSSYEVYNYTNEDDAWAAFEGFKEDCNVERAGIYVVGVVVTNTATNSTSCVPAKPQNMITLLDSYES